MPAQIPMRAPVVSSIVLVKERANIVITPPNRIIVEKRDRQ